MLLTSAACDSEAGEQRRDEYPPPKPKVKPDFIYLRCSEGWALGGYDNDVLLLQLGKIGKYYVSAGPDAEYDSQSYYFEDGFDDLAGRELPTTKKEYDSEMRSVDYHAKHLKGATGGIRETETSIYVPSTGLHSTLQLDRESLSIVNMNYSNILQRRVYAPNFKCKKINRKQLRDELESMRVKYEAYKMRMQAANPGDTRKI